MPWARPRSTPVAIPGARTLAAALAAFTGAIVQTPPAYSAKKIGGEAAYKLARRDTPVLPAAVTVTVHTLDLTGYDHGVATLTLGVSSGFYVRSLAHDLGAQLGTGAHLSALRRTRAGAFGLEEALGWEALAGGGGTARAAVLPLDRLLPDVPGVVLTPEEASRARHGQTVQALVPGGASGRSLRLLDEAGHLIGMADASPERGDGGPALLRPVVILG